MPVIEMDSGPIKGSNYTQNGGGLVHFCNLSTKRFVLNLAITNLFVYHCATKDVVDNYSYVETQNYQAQRWRIEDPAGSMERGALAGSCGA